MKRAAGVLVMRDGLVLAVARRDGRGIGLPCGAVEHDEDPAGAAVRETLEETGCTVVLDGTPYVATCGGSTVSTWRGTLKDEARAALTPDEGYVVWVPTSAICTGPFGDYNRAAIAALYPTDKGMDLDTAFEATSIRDFLASAFPASLRGVAARIVESGAEFSPNVTEWAPRWSGIPHTRRKASVGGVREKLATVLFRGHDCLHNLWGLPRIDPNDPEDCFLYKRTQMCGEVAVLTITEFVLADAWAKSDPALGPVLDQRNALPLLGGPLVGLTTREIAARLDSVLHQRVGRPPAWVRGNPVASAFVADYTRMLEEDRISIDKCLASMREAGWHSPAGPTFRPAPSLDGLELTLWMVDDFAHLARTSPEVDEDLAAFNRTRRAAINFPPGWSS